MPDEKSQEVQKLLKNDAEFKKAFESHRDCERKLTKYDRKAHLTAEEELDRNKLKKHKLAMKDKMEKILSRQNSA